MNEKLKGNYIFVVNAAQPGRTQRFWRKRQQALLEAFPGAETMIAGSKGDDISRLHPDDVLVLVGDDSFFSRQINLYFDQLTKNQGKNRIAFLPDSKDSALAHALQLPPKFEDRLLVLSRLCSIPYDLVRCHYIDLHGRPASGLILNDALIKLPRLKLPWIYQSLVRWAKGVLGGGPAGPNRVTLVADGKVVFEDEFLCGVLLLGSKITGGPRIKPRNNPFKNSFEYFQVNSTSISELGLSLPRLLTGKGEESSPSLFQGQFQELEIKALGQDNSLIADGNELGRLPASFTLLPRALRVISPLNPVQLPKLRAKETRVGLKLPEPTLRQGNLPFKRDAG